MRNDPLIIGIANDHAGIEFKHKIKQQLLDIKLKDDNDISIVDFGGDDFGKKYNYSEKAHELCASMETKKINLGILICGTGIGMCMAANRHTNIRAALCHTPYTAMMARKHNDANVLCLGARVLGEYQISGILETFLFMPFDGGRHKERVKSIEIL
jgi:ribose 5-phosphate isomerase B